MAENLLLLPGWRSSWQGYLHSTRIWGSCVQTIPSDNTSLSQQTTFENIAPELFPIRFKVIVTRFALLDATSH